MSELLLATYLPFNRVHEIVRYFDRSVDAVNPNETLIFLDNVVDDWQMDLLRDKIGHRVVWGNWGSRVLTWISILEKFFDYSGAMLIVDSDNVMDAGTGEFVRREDWRNGSKGDPS